MNKVDDKTRWQSLRSRAVASTIYKQLPMLEGLICRRMLYAYRRGEHRIQRQNLHYAVRAAKRTLTDRTEKNKTQNVMDVFDHGPLDSELWVALDSKTPIEKAASRWNAACMRHLRSGGFGGPLPNSPLPEFVEAVPDWRSYFGANQRLLVLAHQIIKVRATFPYGSTAMVANYACPRPEKNECFAPVPRGAVRERPFFSTSTLHRKQTEFPLNWEEDRSLGEAILGAKVALERFGIPEQDLMLAIEAVVRIEKQAFLRKRFF